MRNQTALLLVLLAGCSSLSEVDQRLRKSGVDEGLFTQPTPSQWVAPTTLQFTVFEPYHHQAQGRFALRLTEEPARTCISGKWFKAVPVYTDLKVPLEGINLAEAWKDPSLQPAYSIEGRIITVELNGGRICDAYGEVRAELGDQVARGVAQPGGIVRQVGGYLTLVLIEKIP
jgi:hypothetical protein